MPRFSPLYRRTMLATLLPLLLAMAVTWALTTAVFSRSLDARVVEQTRRTARVLTESGLPFTQALLDRLAELQQTEFVLLRADGGTPLTSYRELPAEVARYLADRTAASAVTERHLEVGGVPAVVVAQPVDGRSDVRYRELVAVASLGDARAAARAAAVGLAVAMLAAGAIVAVLVHIRVKGITGKLGELVRQADAVAGGDGDTQPELDGADEIGQLARALDDMTARLSVYEQRLAEQSRLTALGQMAARIAHEVRNPLTGLKLHLQLLQERASPDQAPRVQSLLDEVLRLELLVGSSLALARERTLTVAPIDLDGLLGEVLALMRPSLSHRHIAAELQRGAPPGVPADAALVRQAFLNLLVNAAEALPDGGRVLVSSGCDASQQRAWFAIEDSGTGAPRDLLERRGGLSDKPFGLGLGLTLCREVAEAHGGGLRLERASRLGGARFVMELPMAGRGSGVEA
jgi:signal transduction histidine kinase